MTHLLKIEKRFYDRVEAGTKTCEIRQNDRHYQAGDLIAFRYFEATVAPQSAEFIYRITDVLTAEEFPDGLQPGYVALSIRRAE